MKLLQELLETIEQTLFPTKLAPKRVPVRQNKPTYLS